MGKIRKLASVFIVTLLLTGCSSYAADYDVLPDPTFTQQPTETPLPTDPPTTQPEEVPFWLDGLKIQDVTDSTNQNCTFDMCVFLKLTALKTCSSITLYGTTYTEDDDEVDSFDADFSKLKKGKSRIVEFGTDASDDTEDYVELDESTCWK
jgi:PBP1b-binding outer membrane lipoprotein LpoB